MTEGNDTGFALIGIGPGSVGSMTLDALNIAKKADVRLYEAYTALWPDEELSKLEAEVGPIEHIMRPAVEHPEVLFEQARTQLIAILVVGDPMQATTHIDFQLRAEEAGIPVAVVHGISITSLTPGATGLSDYKFGRPTTLTYPYGDWIATSPLEVMLRNQMQGLHTLVLFDLDPTGAGTGGQRPMQPSDALASIEAMMKDKKALQAGTSHELGQNFSKAFEIQFSDEENNLQYPFQTSWGVSTRLIGMIIMAHGDDKGLNLPPKLAPYQVVIIPITPNEDSKESVFDATKRIREKLSQSFRVYVDDRDNISPGFKFNEWELKGVPLRIEIGPRDVENKSVVFSRRDGVDGKFKINFDDVNTKVSETLDNIHNNLLESSRNFRKENTIHVDTYEELISALNGDPGFVTCFWDENSDDEEKVKAETKATLRCYVLAEESTEKAVNNENAQGKLAIFSKAY